MTAALIIPAFIAGILTFLAPCTLPLVPAYLGFIGGVSGHPSAKGSVLPDVRRRVLVNGMFYVAGFSVVFILLGGLFGLGGGSLSHYRSAVTVAGGFFVMLSGLYLMHVFRLPFLRFLDQEHRMPFARHMRPGHPTSSFLFGVTFAMGWSPCIGPILGSVLLLASSAQTFWSGSFLLSVYAAGLAVPFLLLAAGIGHAYTAVGRLNRHLGRISFAGGVFLVFLGVLMVTGTTDLWSGFVYEHLNILHYDAVLDHL